MGQLGGLVKITKLLSAERGIISKVDIRIDDVLFGSNTCLLLSRKFYQYEGLSGDA